MTVSEFAESTERRIEAPCDGGAVDTIQASKSQNSVSSRFTCQRSGSYYLG